MPTTYVVLHRPGRSGKWVELGRAETMLKALAFVTGKGGFWLREIAAETVPDEEYGEAGSDHELEADAAGNASGQAERSSRSNELGEHVGIRPVMKLMPKNAGRGTTCAAISGTI